MMFGSNPPVPVANPLGALALDPAGPAPAAPSTNGFAAQGQQNGFIDKMMSPMALMSLSMIANSGPSLTPKTGFEGVPQALVMANQHKRQQQEYDMRAGALQKAEAEKAEKKAALNRTAQYFSKKLGLPYEDTLALYQTGGMPAMKALSGRDKENKPTDDMREYEFAVTQGYDGTFREWMIDQKSAGLPPQLGSIPTDHQLVGNPQDGYKFEVIPNSPTAREMEADQSADGEKTGQAEVATRVVTSAAQHAREAAAQRDFGPYGQGVVQYLPWTDSAEVSRQTEVLKSNAKIENLNAMRRASPTGGALGSVTEKESEMLAAKSGALDPSSPTFLRDLDDYELTLLQVIHGPEAGKRLFDSTRQGPSNSGDPDADKMVNDLIERYGG